MRSIRAFLLTRLLGGALLVLALAGVVVYLVVTRSLEAQFDQDLAERVQGFASLLFQQQDRVEFEFADQLMPEYERAERPDFFEIWFEDGALLERSDSLHGADLAVPDEAGREPRHWSAPLPDGRAGRFVARLVEVHHVFPEEGPERPQARSVRVVIARGPEELLAARQKVLLECVLVALVLMGLLAAIAWIAVERGLAPAHRLAATLDALEVERLPARLEAGELPVELVPMAQKADALIARVKAALERERRTTADIAHELRTPISELVTVTEVALRNGRDAEHARAALGTVRDVAWHMGRSVSTLLELARVEMGTKTFAREPVDLGALLLELLRPLAAVERERELCLENRVAPGETVTADAHVLRIVLSNLLGNALHYTPRAGRVHCALERGPPGWRLRLENDAPELTPADLASLAEPFWRKDHARTERERSGLGLALSRALAEKTGLELAFELENGVLRVLLASR